TTVPGRGSRLVLAHPGLPLVQGDQIGIGDGVPLLFDVHVVELAAHHVQVAQRNRPALFDHHPGGAAKGPDPLAELLRIGHRGRGRSGETSGWAGPWAGWCRTPCDDDRGPVPRRTRPPPSSPSRWGRPPGRTPRTRGPGSPGPGSRPGGRDSVRRTARAWSWL